MSKRSIYRQSAGDPIDNAVKQFRIMEDAFEDYQKAGYEHIAASRALQVLIDDLSDDQYADYMKRTQP